MTDGEVMGTYLFRTTYEVARLLFGFTPMEWANHLNSIERVDFDEKIWDAFNWGRGSLGYSSYQIISRLTTGRAHWESRALCTYI